MNYKENKPKTIKLSIIISLILSIAIIILILYLTIDANTLAYISTHQIRYEFFFAAIVVNIIYWILWGVRLRILSNAIDENVTISIWESTKIIIANLFLANITPSMAGGEPVRIYLLNKNLNNTRFFYHCHVFDLLRTKINSFSTSKTRNTVS